MNRFALFMCLSYCGCQRVERTPSHVGVAVDAGDRVACAGVPEGGTARPTPTAMGVSFEPDGTTIRLTESSRFAFYDAASLEERRSLSFPGGSRFVDHGDVVLVGEGRRYWIGR